MAAGITCTSETPSSLFWKSHSNILFIKMQSISVPPEDTSHTGTVNGAKQLTVMFKAELNLSFSMGSQKRGGELLLLSVLNYTTL